MKVGFLGLGAMGAHMARNLHRAGLLHSVWNRTRDKADTLARELADVAAPPDPATLVAAVDVAVLCVAADADVRSVIDALVPAAQAGLTVIDCSTVSADTARYAAAALAKRGAGFLDCPVSGGVEGARDAKLAIMCGGERQVFDAMQPVLQAMGATVTYMGPTGAGQATKATNQIMCAGIIRAVAEGMAFASAQGLPLERVVETLGKGAGSSWYFVNRAPFMIRHAFPAASACGCMRRICASVATWLLRSARACRWSRTPLANTRSSWTRATARRTSPAVFRLKERLFAKAP